MSEMTAVVSCVETALLKLLYSSSLVCEKTGLASRRIIREIAKCFITRGLEFIKIAFLTQPHKVYFVLLLFMKSMISEIYPNAMPTTVSAAP